MIIYTPKNNLLILNQYLIKYIYKSLLNKNYTYTYNKKLYTLQYKKSNLSISLHY